jgi:hypothetical protein
VFLHEGQPTIRDAREVQISMTAPAQEILSAAEGQATGAALVRDGVTVVVEPEKGLFIAVQIERCLPQPYFRC